MLKSLALGFVAVSSALLAFAFLLGDVVPPALVAVLVVVSPAAIVVIALARGSRGLGGAGPYVAALAFVLVTSAFGTFGSSGAPVLLGLSASALWMLGGLWLAPLVLLAWAYPRTFASAVLNEEDLEQLRHRARVAGSPSR